MLPPAGRLRSDRLGSWLDTRLPEHDGRLAPCRRPRCSTLKTSTARAGAGDTVLGSATSRRRPATSDVAASFVALRPPAPTTAHSAAGSHALPAASVRQRPRRRLDLAGPRGPSLPAPARSTSKMCDRHLDVGSHKLTLPVHVDVHHHGMGLLWRAINIATKTLFGLVEIEKPPMTAEKGLDRRARATLVKFARYHAPCFLCLRTRASVHAGIEAASA